MALFLVNTILRLEVIDAPGPYIEVARRVRYKYRAGIHVVSCLCNTGHN